MCRKPRSGAMKLISIVRQSGGNSQQASEAMEGEKGCLIYG